MTDKKLPSLPKSDDDYWEGGEKFSVSPRRLPICATHGKDNWMKHKGYVDNHDGTASCKYCSWGCILGGNLKVENGKIVNLWKP